MNFVDYCIYTKNYSALNAIDEYSKCFAKKDYGIVGGLGAGSKKGILNTIKNTQGFLSKRTGSKGYLDSLLHLGRTIDAIRTGRKVRQCQDEVRKSGLHRKLGKTYDYDPKTDKASRTRGLIDLSSNKIYNDIINLNKVLKDGDYKIDETDNMPETIKNYYKWSTKFNDKVRNKKE